VSETQPTHTQALAGHTRKPTPAERERAAQHGAARQPAAHPQDQAGRILGEFVIRVKGGRLGRTDAMGMLLRAMSAHMAQSDNARDALSAAPPGGRAVEAAAYATGLEAEALAAYFRKLYAWGYDDDTTWDDLAAYLPQLYAEAEALAQTDPDVPAVIITPQVAVYIAYAHFLAEGARRFVQAAGPAMLFLRDDDPDDQ
jgi:hypothetical protein